MSTLIINHPTKVITGTISLPTSKSLINRLLVLQKLLGVPSVIHDASTSEDTRLMQQALTQKSGTIQVNHAGTCLRFLTAYFACVPNTDVILQGSERLHQRPMAPLVNALRSLGADISYVHNEGYAPLHIKGKTLQGGTVMLNTSASSQFVSALMLIAPTLTEGLIIKQQGLAVSKPYLQMTANLLQQVGVVCLLDDDIVIKPIEQPLHNFKEMTTEKDWSGASFWYAMAALSNNCKISLDGLSMQSVQGDKIISDYMASYGVQSVQTLQGTELMHQEHKKNQAYFNMIDCPDLVPPMAVAMCALNIPTTFTNVAHLQVKESNRLSALCTELSKCGFDISHSENDLFIKPVNVNNLKTPDFFNTYNDHRMAMSFALLALKIGPVVINDAQVVEKSYPGFWDDLKLVGFDITSIADEC